MDIFELETKAALADMWLHENKMLKEDNAKLREAAQAVVDDANIEPDTGWELPSYCHVERSEILALAALLGGEDGN